MASPTRVSSIFQAPPDSKFCTSSIPVAHVTLGITVDANSALLVEAVLFLCV